MVTGILAGAAVMNEVEPPPADRHPPYGDGVMDVVSGVAGTIQVMGQAAVRVRLDGNDAQAGRRVRVGKYGWVRIAAPCAAQAKLRRLVGRGHARLLNVTVSRHSDGNWYATLCYDRPARVPAERHTPPAGPVVGVDRGVKNVG
jgi:hypothetical protein